MIINKRKLGKFSLFSFANTEIYPNFAIVKGAMHHSLHPKK